ncbi:MAG TPA: hypothetical protein P5323_01385 [Candidatus Moranbacteria bacterium]|nr:hypothetical protein [Candidatus Moranbacteria bacterium]HSA08154.1 hypothetical protein [Candidatus Moranbacteria bacterium]
MPINPFFNKALHLEGALSNPRTKAIPLFRASALASSVTSSSEDLLNFPEKIASVNFPGESVITDTYFTDALDKLHG